MPLPLINLFLAEGQTGLEADAHLAQSDAQTTSPPMFHHILNIKNDAAELLRAGQEVTQLLESKALDPHFVRTVNLGLEEAVTNVLKYGYDDDGEHQIEITLHLTDAELQLVVADDGHEFNPLERPEPDTGKPLEDREPGGLGIHFLRKLFDEVHYRREAQRNILTLRKRLPKPVG